MKKKALSQINQHRVSSKNYQLILLKVFGVIIGAGLLWVISKPNFLWQHLPTEWLLIYITHPLWLIRLGLSIVGGWFGYKTAMRIYPYL